MKKIFLIMMVFSILTTSVFADYGLGEQAYTNMHNFLNGEISYSEFEENFKGLNSQANSLLEKDDIFTSTVLSILGFAGDKTVGALEKTPLNDVYLGEQIIGVLRNNVEKFDEVFGSIYDNGITGSSGNGFGGPGGGSWGAKDYYTSSVPDSSNGSSENITNNYYDGDTVYVQIFDIVNKTFNQPTNIYNEYTNNYYDSHDIYDYSTVNNITYFTTTEEITVNNYYTNLYFMYTTPRYTALTYFDGGGNVVTDKYYYELSDGRNTYDLTEDEIFGTVINYDYIPYKKVAEDDGTFSLFHFNGDIKDDSYYSNTNYSYNAAANYSDSGNFHQALIVSSYGIDEEVDVNFTLGFPAGFAETSEWTLEYRVNIPTIYQWDSTYQWKCNSANNSTCSTEYQAYMDDYDAASKDVIDLPGLSIISKAGGYDNSLEDKMYKINFKGSSIYIGIDELSSKNFTFGLWHSVILQSDGSNVDVFLDGQLVNVLNLEDVLIDNKFVFNHVLNELTPYYYLDEVRLSQGQIYGDVDTVPVTQNQFDSNKVYVLPTAGGYYREGEFDTCNSIVGTLDEAGVYKNELEQDTYLVTSDKFISVDPLTTYTFKINYNYRYFIYEYDKNQNLIKKSTVKNEQELEFTTSELTYFIKYATDQEFVYSSCSYGNISANSNSNSLRQQAFPSSLNWKNYAGTDEIEVIPSTVYQYDFTNRGTTYFYYGSSYHTYGVTGYYFVFFDENKKILNTVTVQASNSSLFPTGTITAPDSAYYLIVIGFTYYRTGSSSYNYYSSADFSFDFKRLDCTEGLIDPIQHSTDFKFQMFGMQYFEEGLIESTIALKSETKATSARYGGVRPTYPTKGQLYFVTNSNDCVSQVQIYDGSDWVETGGVIYMNNNWVSLYGKNLTKLVADEDDFMTDEEIFEKVNPDEIIVGGSSSGGSSGGSSGNENDKPSSDQTVGGTLFGDLLSGLADIIGSIGDILISLFIPSEGFFNNFFDGLNLDFTAKLGFLNSTVDLFSQFIDVFMVSDDSSAPTAVIGTPELEYMGVVLLPAMNINLEEKVDELGFRDLYNMYLSAMDAYIVFRLFRLAGKKYEEVTSL